MLLDTIILVLRETLEAGALISLLVSVGNQHQAGYTWLWLGVLLGIAGAVIYAANFVAVSQWFDYVGQEVLNASMQFTIWLSLLIVCAWLIYSAPRHLHLIKQIMVAAVALALIREGSEIIIFYTGFIQADDVLMHAITSGFVGLSIGVSFGVLCYFAIISWQPATTRRIQLIALTLIASGLAVQATQLLMQIDWLASGKPLWDSSWLLAENSISGQMIYALFGYEASPSSFEVAIYLATMVLVTTLYLLQRARAMKLASLGI